MVPKNMFLLGVIAVVVAALLYSASIDKYACVTDSDCVAEQQCHPTSTINKRFASSTEPVPCTLSCSGPLDCGAGYPACVNSRCSIKQGNP